MLFEDEHILLADKPHFLPVTPGGLHVNECLQNRLRKTTGCETLQALHRLDRETAGLVLFSKNPGTRDSYHELFCARRIEKTYHAIANVNGTDSLVDREWVVKNRLEKGSLRFRMKIADGKNNSHSVIRCLRHTVGRALFELNPVTGKTHQLRIHMQVLGWPITNDTIYPTAQRSSPQSYERPLQLLAKHLRFTDPVTTELRQFTSERHLSFL